MRVSVIIPAAGLGTRMARPQGEPRPVRKQFVELEGQPIILHTIRKFVATEAVTEVVVALRQEDLAWFGPLVQSQQFHKPVRLIEGGDTRQESVENGLAVIDPTVELVAVHDAVRPFIEPDLIGRVIAAAAEHGAAIVGIVPVDTVKQVHLHQVRSTIPRDRLVLAQTPQVFRQATLRRAYERARADNFTGTDECSLVERLEDVEVYVEPGSDRNIKITRPFDLAVARLLMADEMAARAGR